MKKACKRCGTDFNALGPSLYCGPVCRHYARKERVRSVNRERAPFRRIHTSGPRPTGDELASECWCGEQLVGVPLELVRACQTRSCGQPNCGPELLRKPGK